MYTDELLDSQHAERLFMKLITAFPKITESTATLIIERMVENRFTINRANDAINHCIDSYEGWDKVPNIANFIQFDRRVKILSYRELDYLHNTGKVAWSDYLPIDVGQGKPYFAKTIDVQQYKLKQWNANR